MKRIALSLVVVVALPTLARGQQPSAELYGEFRYSYNRADAGDSTHWASANNASRLGVRGEVDAGAFTVFADLQTGVSIDAESSGDAFTQRYYLAGIRGGFGTLTLGRHTTAYKAPGMRLDPFYDSSTLNASGGVPVTGLFAGASYGLSNLTNGWAERALSYSTPALAGFTGNAALYLDTDSDHDFGVGVGYRGYGLDAGLQYHDFGGRRSWAQAAGIDHGLRGHASTGGAGWSAGASYERLEASVGDAQNYLYGVGTLTAISRVTLAVAVGHVDEGGVQPVNGTAVHAGVFYALVPQARVHAIYSVLDADDRPGRSNVALGLTYQFALGLP